MFSCKRSLLKVPKARLNGLLVLGCFKRFLLGQSSSYESLDQGLEGFQFCWVGFATTRISVLGVKTVRNPETLGLNPNTPKNPNILDIPGFAELWASGCFG